MKKEKERRGEERAKACALNVGKTYAAALEAN